MNNHKPTSDDDFRPDELADALQREAIDDRPAFSAGLHRRIIDSVNASKVKHQPGHRPVRHGWAAVAAGLAIGLGIWITWMNRHQAADPTGTIAQLPAPDTTDAHPRPIDLRRLVREEYIQPRLVVPIDPALLGMASDAAQPTEAPAAPPAFPKGLIAAFRPADDAKLALSRLVPPEVRILGKLAEPILPLRSTSEKPL